jgi:3-oxoacyl-[acyl-carrier protein] reductase
MACNFKGKVVIVTGSGSGIGKGIAGVFAKEGASIVVADYDEKGGKATVEELKAAGCEASFVKVDITKQAETEKMAKFAIDTYGTIDVLVNNAGIYPNVMIQDMTESDWDKVMNINMKGGFFCVKAVLPEMMKKNYGRIVFTSSITGPRTAIYGLSHYAASKGGVNGFIKGLAFELAKWNITVNGVEPGNIVTPGLAAQLGEEWMKASAKAVPMGVLGTPEDIGYAMLYLASDEASYVTAHTIIVDGGQIIPESRTAEE